jgi:hypothetical protein
VANQGARRVRSCILGILPGDLMEAAVKQCEITQTHAGGAPEEQIKQLVAAFADLGVDQDRIARFLGHRLDTVIGAEVIRLRKVFTSIRDGMAKAGDFFDIEGEASEKKETATLKEKLKAKVEATGGSDGEPGGKPS